MSSRNAVTVTGNITADPERFGTGAASGVRFTVAEQIGYVSRETREFVEEPTMFWPVTVWAGPLADNIVATLRKGDRVTVTGHYRNNVWETEAGEKRGRIELVGDEVGVSLRWAQAAISRNVRNGAHSAPPLEPPAR